jgi:hypothetical protein
MSEELVAVHCPRCDGAAHRFGHDPSSRLQRYRCKSVICRRQFVPGCPPRPRKYPQVHCPAVVPPWAFSRVCPKAGAFAVIAIAPAETAIAFTKSTSAGPFFAPGESG